MRQWNQDAGRGREDDAAPRDERGRRGGRTGRSSAGRRGTSDDAPRSAMPTSALSSAARGRRGRGRAAGDETTEPEVLAPARIKSIEEHGRKAGRFTVRLEGVRSSTVSADIVERLGLREGVVLQVPQVAALRDAAAALRTYDRALNLLASRARRPGDRAPDVARAAERR